MKKIIIGIMLLAIIVGGGYFAYTNLSNSSTPSKKKEKSQIKTDFEPEIQILDGIKEDFTAHGNFPITLDATQFKSKNDDPFGGY